MERGEAIAVQIITATTRPERAGGAVASWAVEAARAASGVSVELVDLAAIGLPMFDEPRHPAKREYAHEHTKRWSAIVDRADAFVFVMPEYNHFPPGALVNAVDFLVHEWAYKPAGFVSYGGISGGVRGVELFKSKLTTLRVMPIPRSVIFPRFTEHLEGDAFEPPAQSARAMIDVIDELARWARALRPMRAQT